MKLVVQIPCFNEGATLATTLAEIPQKIEGIDEIEILVIDDGSVDDTIEVAKTNGVKQICRHVANRGLGRAFRTGLHNALVLGADIIVNTDGDGQYVGSDIAKLVQPVLSGQADIVIGDRQTATNPEFGFANKFMQWLGSRVVRSLSGANVPDAVSGFRAISRQAAMDLNILSTFSYTIEMIIQAANKQMAIVSLPVETNPKTRESRLYKHIPQFVARQAVGTIRMYAMYRPMRFFFYIGAVLSASGIAPILRFVYLYFSGDGDGNIQSLVIGSALLTMGFMVLVAGLLSDLVSQNRQLTELALARIRAMELDGNAQQGRVTKGQDS